jgi:hypothetical protein
MDSHLVCFLVAGGVHTKNMGIFSRRLIEKSQAYHSRFEEDPTKPNKRFGFRQFSSTS